MQLFFRKTESEETATDGQAQRIELKISNEAEGLTLKKTYKNLFIGKTTIITNRHAEKESCSEVEI